MNGQSLYSSDGLWCNGGFACTGTKLLEAADEIYCRGAGSCSDIDLARANLYATECAGTNSCQYSTLHTQVSFVGCMADFSCHGTYIISSDDISSWGPYGLVDSIVNSTGATGEMWVSLLGYYSGYNLTIHCTDGYTCRIFCYSKGCINTRIVCADTANCVLDCDSTERATDGSYPDCAVTFNSSELADAAGNEFESNYGIDYPFDEGINLTSLYLLPLHEDICTNVGLNTKSCEDDEECWKTSVDRSNKAGEDVLCCSGDEACKDSFIWLNSTNNYNHKTICLGRESCDDGVFNYVDDHEFKFPDDLDNDKKSGEIYCHGYEACHQSIIDNNYTSLVYCGGEESCEGARIRNVDKVVCAGHDACEYTYLINTPIIYGTAEHAIQNGYIRIDEDYLWSDEISVYLLGWRAGYNLTIDCGFGKKCNVICGVYGGCNNTFVYCVGECNVTCDFDTSDVCPEVEIIAPPTSIPTAIPTSIPTAMPAKGKQNSTMFTTTPMVTQENPNPHNGSASENIVNTAELKTLFQINTFAIIWFVFLFGSFTVFGYLDGKWFRKNELFRWTSVTLSGAYTLDFTSGMCAYRHIVFVSIFNFQ